MPVQAIVYSSNTGFTAQYAAMLGRKTELPVYTLAEAAQKLQKGARIVYMSWLMAGTLVDYKKASKLFDVAAVCSVGLNATQAQADKTRKSSGVPVHVPLFPLQGGYDESKLTGMYRFMMKLVAKMLINQISAKSDKTAEDERMLETLRHGGSYVQAENLIGIADWLESSAH